MSFIDFNEDNAVEPQTAPDQSEQELVIVASKLGQSQKGKRYIQCQMTCPAIKNFKDFTYFVNLPSDDDDENTIEKKKWRLKQFKQVVGLSGGFEVPDSDGVGQDDLAGARFFAIVREEEDAEYGMQNSVRKILAPGR